MSLGGPAGGFGDWPEGGAIPPADPPWDRAGDTRSETATPPVDGPSGRSGHDTEPATDRAPIRLLPDAVAARIAAGEVVERPASVVKELVENALDAGASRVRIDVRGGGLSLIRVGDDGCGIPAAELGLACRRHATSKLPTPAGPNGHDPGRGLEAVRTLGFRGEALPSIAAVAELAITSATDDSGLGHRLGLRDGRVVADEPAPRPRGTTVVVRGLFQNVPARLAAAARAQTELAHLAQTVRRLALAAPAVALELVVDDRPVLRTTGAGDLAAALVEVYGSGLAGALLPLGPVEVAGARLWGVVAGPEVTRPGRDGVNLIVNGRWVQPRGLLTLVETAYRPVLPRGRHPVLALVVETPPDRVDVNVHPAKLEVRLRDERPVGAALGELVRAALARRPIPLTESFAVGLAAVARPAAVAEDAAPWDDDAPIVTPGLPPLRLVGQVRARMLLLEGPAGFYLVDQHRAHERILYERLAAAHGADAPEPVVLPEPLLLELRPAQLARLAHRLDELAALGFDLEGFGGRAFLLRTAPALPGVTLGPGSDPLAALAEPAELAASLLTLAEDDGGEGEGWRERLLVRLACRTAVRRGRPLDRSTMRALVDGLGRSAAPAVCPHGSPLLMHVADDLLERQFDWR